MADYYEDCVDYHEWEVLEVEGTLPHQELHIECKKCGASTVVDFQY